MRKTESDMEAALEMPRLRAVPEPTEAPAEDDPSDAALLARVAKADGAAFEVLYHRYVRSIFGLALRRLHDRAQAEEVTQDAFAAVWRSAQSYKPERGSAGGWLYTVARNAIVDRLRRNSRRADTSYELPELASPEGGPDEQAEQSYTAWRVHRALEELNPNERQVIELAYWSGMSQSEVAEFLDQPLGTVKTRTRSALARLADVLEGDVR
jgi:RNA polymerase sigma-70 factor (ECF subfamily)